MENFHLDSCAPVLSCLTKWSIPIDWQTLDANELSMPFGMWSCFYQSLLIHELLVHSLITVVGILMIRTGQNLISTLTLEWEGCLPCIKVWLAVNFKSLSSVVISCDFMELLH